MGYKRKKTNLGLYQSKSKRRKIAKKVIIDLNESSSNIEKAKEPEPKEDKSRESIEEEMSVDEYIAPSNYVANDDISTEGYSNSDILTENSMDNISTDPYVDSSCMSLSSINMEDSPLNALQLLHNAKFEDKLTMDFDNSSNVNNNDMEQSMDVSEIDRNFEAYQKEVLQQRDDVLSNINKYLGKKKLTAIPTVNVNTTESNNVEVKSKRQVAQQVVSETTTSVDLLQEEVLQQREIAVSNIKKYLPSSKKIAEVSLTATDDTKVTINPDEALPVESITIDDSISAIEKSNVSSPIDVDENHDINVCSCHIPEEIKYAVELVKSDEVLIPFLKRLNEKEMMDDYLLLLQLMSSGALQIDNIPFYLALERAKLQSCESTTGMVYNQKTLDYWTVFYRTCKGAGLNLASGSKHGGHVTGNKCDKGHYDPCTGSFNFAVPDVKTILRHQKRIEKYIFPGIIQSAFPLLNTRKQYILEYDGKRLASGLDKDNIGQINLWGYEGPPSLQESKRRLDEELSIIENLNNIEFNYNCELLQVVPKIIQIISIRIKEKRYSLLGYEKYRNDVERMSKDNPKIKKKYELSLGNTKAAIFTIKTWIASALDMNKCLCKILSKVNGTHELFHSDGDVDLSKQGNVRTLFPVEYLENKFDLDDHTFIVKQRSDKWKELRKCARLTGSTMYKSIGLDTLKREKEHFDEFVSKLDPPEFSKEVQDMLKHGTDNEINGLATVVSIFMPAFTPSCSRYIEDGANFIAGDLRNRLLEVSTDGIIKCRHHGNNYSCSSELGLQHTDMIIEIKCPYPNDKVISVHYTPPIRYISQMLCGMKCKNVDRCLYVSYSFKSTTFCICTFDEKLWNVMWELAKSKYDIDKPTKPKTLPHNIKEIRHLLQQYSESHVEFVAELPSVNGTEGSYDNIEISNPFRCNPQVEIQVHTQNEISADILQITSKCTELIKEGHELSRKKASEILAFLLCDSDREKSSKGIDNIPIAYAMKGYSLTNSVMRKMIEDVRNSCKEQDIDILCEVSDGQWRNIVCNDIYGEPLTRIQFQRKCWNNMMAITKKDLIQMLLNCSLVEETTLMYWSNNDQILMVPGTHTMGNITVACDFITKRDGSYQRKLSVSSAGGSLSNIPLMEFIETVPPEKNRTIWKRSNRSTEPVVDIDQSDVLSLLPSDVVNYKNDIITGEENDNDDVDMDFEEDQNASIVSEGSVSNENNILTRMLEELRKLKKKDIWSRINTKMLYTYYLSDADAIAESFVVAELNVLNQVFKSFTGQNIFKSGDNKEVKVNLLSATFGNKSTWTTVRNVRRNPKSLKDIVFKYVSSGKIPKPVIVVSAATIHYQLNYKCWENSSTVPLKVFIPHRKEYFDLFSFPEYSERRKSLEPRTLDPTHILTNLRSKACRSGFSFFDRKSLLRVSKRDKKLLPRPMVTEIPDQQNAELAKKLFSKRVQRIMERNGDLDEAEFVQLVRQWYKACDERGLHPNERIDRLINMHQFLVKDVDFGKFPPPGAFVKGIPIVTYEGLLQCISTRITLYKLAQNNCYNNRAISTLGIESFFASLSKADFTMTGCPKATQIHKILPIMMDYNTHKHNPDKIFAMDPRRGAPYPYYNMDKITHKETNSVEDNETIFKPHNFDKYVKKTKKREKFKTTIDGLNDTERGKLTIRGDYYKFNASKLTGMQKLSLPDDMDV